MPNVAIADTGKLVHIILEAGPVYLTKTIAFWAQALSEADKLAEVGNCMLIYSTSTVCWLFNCANPGYRLQCPNPLRPSERERVPRNPHDAEPHVRGDCARLHRATDDLRTVRKRLRKR